MDSPVPKLSPIALRSQVSQRRGLLPVFPHDRLDYSLRRFFVDQFFFRHVAMLRPGSRVLDLGGTKVQKRGSFDIERYALRVIYANISTAKRPDVQADGAHLPFVPACFDAVICAELLEHVRNPEAVLREVSHVLVPGGILLITVPFLSRIHGDPTDYGRYTDSYWLETLSSLGFVGIRIEKQGLFWSVMADMLRGLVNELVVQGRVHPKCAARLLTRLVAWGCHTAVTCDSQPGVHGHPYLSAFTTGFGIVARAPVPVSEAIP